MVRLPELLALAMGTSGASENGEAHVVRIRALGRDVIVWPTPGEAPEFS